MRDDPLYKAAVNVIRYWNKHSDTEKLSKAIEQLKTAVMIENRFSWTDDYYELDDNFFNRNGDE